MWVPGLSRSWAPKVFAVNSRVKRLLWDLGPCEKILWISQWKAVRGLCMILHRSLWEAHEEFLVKSSRCPSMISYKSLWEDLVEILFWNPPQEVFALRSQRCSALVFVWKFLWDAHRSSCMKIVWAPLDKYIILYYIILYLYYIIFILYYIYNILYYIILYIYRVLLLQLRSWLTSSVTVPYPLLLVSGTLTSYLPHCLGSLAGVIFCFIRLVLWRIVNVHPFGGAVLQASAMSPISGPLFAIF